MGMKNFEWETYMLESGTVYKAGLGPVAFLVRFRDGDWRISAIEGDGWSGPPTPASDPGLAIHDWSRRIVSPEISADHGRIAIYPELPDRPLVLRPPGPVIIPTGIKTTLYVAIPVSIGVSALEPREFTLGSFPAVFLSSTWMGDQAAGKPAYTLRTDLHRHSSSLSSEPWMAACAVTINNLSPLEYDMNGISLDVGLLGVWADGPQLITDKMVITIKGGDQVLQNTVDSSLPRDYAEAVRLCPPRKEGQNRIHLQSLPGIRKRRSGK